MNYTVKKTLSILLFMLLTITPITTGCSRMGDTNELSDSNMIDTSDDSQWTCDSLYDSNFQWKVNGLFGATDDELSDYYSNTIYCNDMMLEMYAATPISLLLGTRNELTYLVYDFSSGTFTSACKDSICDHESCVWRAPNVFFYHFGNAIFIVRTDEKTIYKADSNGENVMKIYTGSEIPCDLKYLDGVLYFQEYGVESGSDDTFYTLYSIADCDNAKALLTSRGENNALSYLPVGNGSVLYCTASDTLFYDSTDNSTTVIGSDIFLRAYESGTVYYETNDGFYASSNVDLSDSVKLTQEWADVKFICDRQIYYSDTVDGIDGLYVSNVGEETPQLVYAWKEKGETAYRIGNLLFVQRSHDGKERYSIFEMVDLSTGETFTFTNKRK